MKRVRRILKSIVAAAVGLPVLALGIVLIPLPGPGVLVTIFGLFILSFGFESVKQPLDRYANKIKQLYKQTKQRYDEFVDKHNLK